MLSIGGINNMREYNMKSIRKAKQIQIVEIEILERMLQEIEAIENMQLKPFEKLETKISELSGRYKNMNMLFDMMAQHRSLVIKKEN